MIGTLKYNLEVGTPVEIADNTTGLSAGTWTPTTLGNHSFDHPTTHGWYYNWTIATAGGQKIPNTNDALNSICPVGWRLPAYGDNKSYNTLYTTYGSGGMSALTANPLSFETYGGLYGGDQRYSNTGSYWTARSGYYLYFESTSVNPQRSDPTYYGMNLRCVSV